MESKNAVLYVRSATFKRPGDNNSVDMQLEKLWEYAGKNDYQVLAEFVDEGEAGSTEDRPALQKMLAMAMTKPRSLDVVLIWDMARLSRSRILSITLREQLRRNGVVIISASQPCVEPSDEGMLITDRILSLIAEINDGNVWKK